MTFQADPITAGGATWFVASTADVTPAELEGHSFRILADGGRTGGAFSLTEATSPSGAAVGWHAHDASVECFYVAEGRYRLTVSGVVHDLGPGDFALVPRGAPHGFEVVEGTARAIVLFAPAGFEEVFRQMPEIFGTPGEPGPIFEAANRAVATRLLDHCGPGPAALVRPASGSAETVLAEPLDTRTQLRIELRQDETTGDLWSFDPLTTTVYAVSGGYRVDLPGGRVTLWPGQLLAPHPVAGTGAAAPPAAATAAAARAVEAGSRALLLHVSR